MRHLPEVPGQAECRGCRETAGLALSGVRSWPPNAGHGALGGLVAALAGPGLTLVGFDGAMPGNRRPPAPDNAAELPGLLTNQEV
jgi:hypothetical protein